MIASVRMANPEERGSRKKNENDEKMMKCERRSLFFPATAFRPSWPSQRTVCVPIVLTILYRSV